MSGSAPRRCCAPRCPHASSMPTSFWHATTTTDAARRRTCCRRCRAALAELPRRRSDQDRGERRADHAGRPSAAEPVRSTCTAMPRPGRSTGSICARPARPGLLHQCRSASSRRKGNFSGALDIDSSDPDVLLGLAAGPQRRGPPHPEAAAAAWRRQRHRRPYRDRCAEGRDRWRHGRRPRRAGDAAVRRRVAARGGAEGGPSRSRCGRRHSSVRLRAGANGRRKRRFRSTSAAPSRPVRS